MDPILLSEVQKIHMQLRGEEAELTAEEKKAKHLAFVEHLRRLIRFHYTARNGGLLELEEEAMDLEDTPENAFDKELMMMIVDGCEPGMLRDIILLKYFSTEQTTYQALKNLMSILGMLNIQAGEHPVTNKRMLKNMLPADVQELVEVYSQ